MALFNNESINGFSTGNYSLQLLNKINPDRINLVSFSNKFSVFQNVNVKKSFDDFGESIDGVKQGHYWGVMAFHSNFTQAVKNKFLAFDTDPENLNASSIHLHLDMTSKFSIIVMNETINDC